MRELLQLAELRNRAEKANGLQDLQEVVLDLVEHLYRKEYDRERGLRK